MPNFISLFSFLGTWLLFFGLISLSLTAGMIFILSMIGIPLSLGELLGTFSYKMILFLMVVGTMYLTMFIDSIEQSEDINTSKSG